MKKKALFYFPTVKFNMLEVITTEKLHCDEAVDSLLSFLHHQSLR